MVDLSGLGLSGPQELALQPLMDLLAVSGTQRELEDGIVAMDEVTTAQTLVVAVVLIRALHDALMASSHPYPFAKDEGPVVATSADGVVTDG